jgi:Cof subfamily protein (haloacid dehalogenase superfamily)
MNIKLLAIDMDGTLLDSHKLISEKCVDAVKNAVSQGVRLVLSTGRPLTGIMQYLKQLEINKDDEYAITYNGALVRSILGNDQIVRHVINYDDFLEVEKLSRKLHIHMHVVSNDAVYTFNRNVNFYTINDVFHVNMSLLFRSVEEVDESIEIIKIMYADEPTLLDDTSKEIQNALGSRLNVVRSAPHYYDIMNKNANKGAALKLLAKRLGIKREETMTIGDGENDLQMFENAGVSVAMGNSSDFVKSRAKFVTKTNNEDGVAHAIMDYLN